MRKLIVIIGLVCGVLYYQQVKAEAIATLPNKAGGKIVLTDEICVDPVTNEVYNSLRRAYNYSPAGGTDEGCWLVEDETVVVIWVPSNGAKRMRSRYPAENFTMLKKKGTPSRGYNY